MEALLIPADRRPSVVNLAEDIPGRSDEFLIALRAHIGCQIVRRVELTQRWSAWIDDEATLNELPTNYIATSLANSYGAATHILRGTVIIIGTDNGLSRSASLTSDQVGSILQHLTDPPPRC